jgi:hypothetical protein
MIVNPGSVGLPGYDGQTPVPYKVEVGTPDAGHAIIERISSGLSATIGYVPYDNAAAGEMTRANGMALTTGWIASVWLTGWWETIGATGAIGTNCFTALYWNADVFPQVAVDPIGRRRLTPGLLSGGVPLFTRRNKLYGCFIGGTCRSPLSFVACPHRASILKSSARLHPQKDFC